MGPEDSATQVAKQPLDSATQQSGQQTSQQPVTPSIETLYRMHRTHPGSNISVAIALVIKQRTTRLKAHGVVIHAVGHLIFEDRSQREMDFSTIDIRLMCRGMSPPRVHIRDRGIQNSSWLSINCEGESPDVAADSEFDDDNAKLTRMTMEEIQALGRHHIARKDWVEVPEFIQLPNRFGLFFVKYSCEKTLCPYKVSCTRTTGAWVDDIRETTHCDICYDEEPLDNEVVAVTPCCQHPFHGHCLAFWVAYEAKTCPFCRQLFKKVGQRHEMAYADDDHDDVAAQNEVANDNDSAVQYEIVTQSNGVADADVVVEAGAADASNDVNVDDNNADDSEVEAGMMRVVAELGLDENLA